MIVDMTLKDLYSWKFSCISCLRAKRVNKSAYIAALSLIN